MQNYVTEQKQEIVHLWDHVFGRNETDAEYVSIHLHVRVLWTMLDKFTNIYIYANVDSRALFLSYNNFVSIIAFNLHI